MTRKLLPRRDPMGQIHAFVRVTNLNDPTKFVECRAVVDTGASHLTLPAAWRDDLGPLEIYDTVEAETATQEYVPGDICGPVSIEILGFRKINGEVMFIEMKPKDGEYEPIIGYLPLEALPVAVDMLAHRPVRVPASIK